MIDVLTEQIEEEPVAHRRLLHHQLDTLWLDPDHRYYLISWSGKNPLAVAQLEEVGAEGGGDAESQPVDDHESGECPQDEHPEPEEDVDLLVEDVDRQDAEGVVLLKLPRRAKFVKCALCQSEDKKEVKALCPFGNRLFLQEMKVWWPGENVNHRVDPVFLVAVSKG